VSGRGGCKISIHLYPTTNSGARASSSRNSVAQAMGPSRDGMAGIEKAFISFPIGAIPNGLHGSPIFLSGVSSQILQMFFITLPSAEAAPARKQHFYTSNVMLVGVCDYIQAPMA